MAEVEESQGEETGAVVAEAPKKRQQVAVEKVSTKKSKKIDPAVAKKKTADNIDALVSKITTGRKFSKTALAEMVGIDSQYEEKKIKNLKKEQLARWALERHFDEDRSDCDFTESDLELEHEIE